jgi:hypothetical protein
MSDLKELVKQYQYAYRYAQKLPKLRVELIQAIKKERLQTSVFEINDTKLTYQQYEDKDGITQKLIRSVLQESYPNLDAERFIQTICAARKTRKVETIKVTPSGI